MRVLKLTMRHDTPKHRLIINEGLGKMLLGIRDKVIKMTMSYKPEQRRAEYLYTLPVVPLGGDLRLSPILPPAAFCS